MPARTSIAAITLAATVLCGLRFQPEPVFAAGTYPLTLSLDARAKTGAATVTSKVNIRVERLIDETRRTRALDGLKFNGYGGFLNVIKTLQPLGTIAIEAKSVPIKYAWETETNAGRRLILASDQPLVFLTADPTQPRAGYELTVVDLTFDASGRATGTMAGAARVKPAGDGEVTLDTFAGVSVELSGRQAP